MNKKIVVIINGPAGAGKDTIISEYAKQSENSVFNYSTIDYYKELAKRHFGWDENKDEKGRQLLSDIKRISAEYNDLPTKMALDKIKCIANTRYENDVVIFIHIREKDETEKLITSFNDENIEGCIISSAYVYTNREIEGFDNKSDSFSADWKKAAECYDAFIVNDNLDKAVNDLSEFIDLIKKYK